MSETLAARVEEPGASARSTAGLAATLEAILFVAEAPVSVSDLARASDASEEEVELALQWLAGSLEGGGLLLQRPRGMAQLVTAPAQSLWVERFLGLELSTRLSAAALETLAIIAYGQPITRAEIDAVRGVNSSGTLRTLIQRELVEETGRLETVGNPYQYATTPGFLHYFGLRSLEDLPPLAPEEAAKLLMAAEAARRGEGDPGGV